MRIGELASATGTSLQTLRFYERRGLLGKTNRTRSGYRNFSAETVRIVHYIKQSQKLGFTLNEIKELLDLREKAGGNSADVRGLAQGKLENVEDKLKKLELMRDELKHVLKTCDCTAQLRCPALENLDYKHFQ